jgi:hypothetical protein
MIDSLRHVVPSLYGGEYCLHILFSRKLRRKFQENAKSERKVSVPVIIRKMVDRVAPPPPTRSMGIKKTTHKPQTREHR